MILYTMGHKVFHVRRVSFLSCSVSVEIVYHQYFFVLHEPVTISMYWLARQLEQDIYNKNTKECKHGI